MLIIAVNVPILNRFTMADESSGHIIFQDKAEKYKEFYISFTHSVNRTPVNEYYRISGDKLILEKGDFYSYGAGMPEAGEYGSSKPVVAGGVVQINNINKEFKKVTYFAGTFANHNLNAKGTKIFFTELVKPQTPVTIEVKKISVITILMSYWLRKQLLIAAELSTRIY